MNITILTGSDELNFSLDRYLRFVFGGKVKQIFTARLGEPESLQFEMLSSHLWIAEAFNPEDIENPEGFRTVKKFAGKARALLLFVSLVPQNFPREGHFWLTLPCPTTLYEKIKAVLDSPCPTINDYQHLETLWPLLKGGPSRHHHDGHG